MKDLIKGAIQSGMNALGDGQETVTYTSVGTTSYNATTGVITTPKTTYAVLMVMDQYSRREVDGDAIRPEDVKGLVAVLNLTPTPTLNDTVTRANGTVYSVISIRTDPMDAHWQLQLRRP